MSINMSNNSINATEILESWHANMQKIISDPKLAEFMQQSYQQLASNLNSFYEGHNAANHSQANQSSTMESQHRALEERIDELEARIKLLERAVAGPRSKKR